MARSSPYKFSIEREEQRPDGSVAAYGPGNVFLGAQPRPQTPEEAGAMQGRQDSAYIAARDGTAPTAPAAPRYTSSTSLGPSSIANNGYGTPINRESTGLPMAGADGKTPYGRSMDNIAKGDLSGFKGQRTPTPREVFGGQSLNGGSGKTYGVDGGSVTFSGGSLPKGYAGYQTADGKYKTIGPNGEVGIHENEQAAIASFGAQPVAPAATGERPLASFTPAQQMTMQRPVGSAAGRAFGVVDAANPTAPAAPAPTAAPLPSYTDVLAPAPTASAAAGRRQYAPPAPTPDTPRALTASELARTPSAATRTAQPAPAPRPGATTRATDGRGNPRRQPAQVMAYDAPGNPVSAAAPQDLSQSPITAAPEPVSPIMPAMQTSADALRTTSPTAQLNTAMKKRPQQVAANVFTRPRNFSMRGNLMPA